MKHLCTVLFLLVSLCTAAQTRSDGTIDNPRLKGLDTAFQRALKTFHAAGFAVAVVEKNKVIYAKGFGYRNLEKKLPVTPNTVFDIGSTTKAFTAALIGQLQHEGKVDLEKPVTTIVPGLRFYNDEMNNMITLRDMMSHRTGLPRHDLSWAFFPTESRDSLIQRIRFLEPTAHVRETAQYNNFMFVAQGYIAEKLTGKSWEENVRERFFVPLGMTSTHPDLSDLYRSSEPATGYMTSRGDFFHQSPNLSKGSAMAPCGAINSNVNDMAKWVTAWINGGKYEGKEIIPSDFYNQAISSQMVFDSNLPTAREHGVYFSNYGLGWFLSSYKGHYRVEHGGNVPGFSTSVCFFPTDSIGIIVLSNQHNSFIPLTVRNLITDRLLGQKYDDWTGYYKALQIEGEKEEQAVKNALNAPHREYPTTHPLSGYSGTYFNPGYGRYQVFFRHDSLFTLGVTGTAWLKHYSYDTFDLFGIDKTSGIDTTTVPFRLQFLINARGGVEGASAVYQEGLKPIVFTKEQNVMTMAVKDLEKYAGDYDLNSAIVKVYTKPAGGLYVLAPNLPEYELLPIGNDKFAVKAVTGYYVQFEKNSAGKITGVTFMQPTGNYKATKK